MSLQDAPSLAAPISAEQFRLLADNMPVLCWIADSTGYITWYNRRWYEYTGTTPAEMEGWGWQAVHDPRTLDTVMQRWIDSLATGQSFDMVFPLRSAAGEFHSFLTRVQPYRDASGRITHWFGNNVDISAQIAAEQALSELNAGLERRVAQEIAAREEAQARLAQAEKMSALGQLAGGVAHDFNNVIQSVAGGAALIARHANDPEKVKKFARLIEEAANRGASITRRLLTFSRRGELRSGPVDVEALLERVREALPPLFGPAVHIELDVAPDLPEVLADEGQLETALINLATNARDAINGEGVIKLAADLQCVDESTRPEGLAPGAYVRLAVIDGGPGMDEATRRRAREPFFTTKGHGKGTGLGLSMASSFAVQSRGALAIDSAPGRGCKVTIWLPTAEEATA